MNTLDYHKPERPKSEARWGFRLGAWVLFLGSLATLSGGVYELVRGGLAGLVLIIPMLPGCWMFGSIAIFGRLPRLR